MSSTLSQLLVVTALLTLCSPGYSQRGSIEPTGALVKLNLIVVDSNDHAVDAVKKDDIRVVENKQEQSVLGVEPDQRPTDIVIEIDASGSFKDLLPYATAAAKMIIDNRRPTDEVALIRFISSDKIDTVHDFSTNNETLVKSLSLFRPEGGQSAVVDALFLAAGHLKKYKAEEDRRKVLVVITDGEDRNSYYKKEDLLKRLRETGVQVFALAITTKLDNESGFIRSSPRERAEKFLKSVVNETGGRLLFSKKPKELGEATEEVLRNLNHSFLITYRSSDTSGKKGFRKVDVTLISDSKQKPIVAQGYFTPDKDLSNKNQ